MRPARRLSSSSGPIRGLIVLTIALAGAACGDDVTHPPGPDPEMPFFRGIGDLPGGDDHSEALAISDDGMVVIGRSASDHFDEEGFRFAADTLTSLTGPGGTHVSGEPRSLTPDGSVIAGKISGAGLEAARWTASTGWVTLGDIAGGGSDCQALGISSDGAVIVGWGTSSSGYEAARWVGGQAIAMGDLPGGVYNSAAALVADDGTIVGTGYSIQGPEAFRWTEASGFMGLGDLPGGDFSSEPFGMTPDGAVIVGEATSAAGIEAFRWTEAGGLVALGDLPGGAHQSIAFDVSGDGSVIVGYGTTASGPRAFVWDAAHGLRTVAEVLTAAGVTTIDGWTLTEATGISADGKVIVGNATNPSGWSEGWVARIP